MFLQIYRSCGWWLKKNCSKTVLGQVVLFFYTTQHKAESESVNLLRRKREALFLTSCSDASASELLKFFFCWGLFRCSVVFKFTFQYLCEVPVCAHSSWNQCKFFLGLLLRTNLRKEILVNEAHCPFIEASHF